MTSLHRISVLLLALHCSVFSFCQNKDSFAVDRPDRYRLVLPKEWDKNKLIEAITDILPQTIDELKNMDFCTTCNGGYSVKLSIDSLTIAHAQTSMPVEIGSIPHYTFTFDYGLYAALVVLDSSGKPFTMLRLFGTDEVMSYMDQFTLPPQNITYRLQYVYDNRGRVIGRRYVQEARAMNIANPRISPLSVLTESFILNICEKRIYEIRKLLKKFSQH